MSATLQIKPLLIGVLETALNKYLNLGDGLEQLLTPLAGKVIAIHITPFAETVFLCPSQQQVQILDSYYGTVDTTLSGSLAAFGFMGLSATPMHALFQGKVRIDGDPDVARHLQNLFGKLDINLESKLAAIAGERFSQQVSSLFRGSWQWSRSSLTTLRLNLAEFLQEETRDLPAKPEADQFFHEVDDCRSEYERLNARLNQLTVRITNHALVSQHH